jgi:hypothetical protein
MYEGGLTHFVAGIMGHIDTLIILALIADALEIILQNAKFQFYCLIVYL